MRTNADLWFEKFFDMQNCFGAFSAVQPTFISHVLMCPHSYEFTNIRTVLAGMGHFAFIHTFGVLGSTVMSDTPHKD